MCIHGTFISLPILKVGSKISIKQKLEPYDNQILH